jgi:hypothetical protein
MQFLNAITVNPEGHTPSEMCFIQIDACFADAKWNRVCIEKGKARSVVVQLGYAPSTTMLWRMEDFFPLGEVSRLSDIVQNGHISLRVRVSTVFDTEAKPAVEVDRALIFQCCAAYQTSKP